MVSYAKQNGGETDEAVPFFSSEQSVASDIECLQACISKTKATILDKTEKLNDAQREIDQVCDTLAENQERLQTLQAEHLILESR